MSFFRYLIPMAGSTECHRDRIAAPTKAIMGTNRGMPENPLLVTSQTMRTKRAKITVHLKVERLEEKTL